MVHEEQQIKRDSWSYDNDCIARKLIDYIIGIGCGPELENAIDWLGLSYSIASVTVEPDKYDDCLYCGMAWDAEYARSKVLSGFSTLLIKFHFVWGALESIVTSLIDNKKIEKYGKINAACGYIKNSQIVLRMFPEYKALVDRFLDEILCIKQFEKDLFDIGITNKEDCISKDYVDDAGKGIFVVYKVRNRFAHGNLYLPYPVDPEDDASEMIGDSVIRNATTIVLMTIAILFLVDLGDEDFELVDFPFDEDNTIAATEFLKGLFKKETNETATE